MQNRIPNHHDDMSVVELNKHHDEFVQSAGALSEVANFMAALGDDSMFQGLEMEHADIHAVQYARVADLNKVLEAKKDQEKNVAGNNARYARGEKKYGLFSTVAVKPVDEAVSREASPSVLRASK